MGKSCKTHFKEFNIRDEGFFKIKKTVTNTRFIICTLLTATFMLACGKGEIIPSRKAALEKTVEAKLAPASADKRIAILGRTRGLGMKDEEYQRFNTEEYNRIYENTFLEVKNNPLSTFSIDVDTASYSNIRRFINRNSLPPKDAVRIEEMINYFTYEYPQPDGGHPFSIITEISASPWNPSYRLVHIGLQGKKIALDKMPPSNLVFLIDVSGSMDSPDKLPLLQRAFKLLVNQMRPIDRISIVVYAGAAGLILPSTPGNYKNRIIAAIDKLYAGGSTAGGMGIKLAYRIAKQNYLRNGNNRVILATDGDFNVGVSSTSELVRLVENKRRGGIFLTVLGFGTGNYKDSRMESLADKGNGNYAYIDSILEARKVLLKEMGGTLFTIAKDVKIQVEFNPVLVKAYRLIGYENRILKSEDFNDDKKDAGELGSGHSVTALYEIIPKGVSTDLPAIDPLKYQETRIREHAQRSKEIMTIKFRYKEPSGRESRLIVKPVLDQNTPIDETTNNFRFSAAVAEFGMLLRDSKFKGGSSYDRSLELAQMSVGRDTEGYRAEFIRLVKMAKLLAGK
jgi:Ca-activated chloride channel family protein